MKKKFKAKNKNKKLLKKQNSKNSIKKISREKINTYGLIHIHSSYNNTIITPTDKLGNAYASWGTGMVNFNGSKKGTSYAANKTSIELGKQLYKAGLRYVDVICKGPAYNRLSALKGIIASNIKIMSIIDKTPIPFNGCRPKKKRKL